MLVEDFNEVFYFNKIPLRTFTIRCIPFAL